MSHFVIKWATYGYVTKRSPDHKPYAREATDPDAKAWKTRANAERFLTLKDPHWAAQCVIEEVK